MADGPEEVKVVLYRQLMVETSLFVVFNAD